MKTFLAIVGMVAGVAILLYGLRCWNVHDARYLSSFQSLEELRASEVGGCTRKTAFRQDGKDFVGITYYLRKLPPRFLFRWLGPLSEPYLIFDRDGQCVDKSSNYHDDHLFIHRWPALGQEIESCKCGKVNSLAAAEERLPQEEKE